MIPRREFIGLLGGAAAAWPLAARAQQAERARQVGVLMSSDENNAEEQARVTVFLREIQRLGWTEGRNIQIDIRWGAGDADRLRRYAAQLVALTPEVVLASGGVTMQALTNRAVPIVFVQVLDPVGAGYVASLARPGGNITGFTNFDYGMSEKWLELLKQIAPRTTRAAVLRDSFATKAGQRSLQQSRLWHRNSAWKLHPSGWTMPGRSNARWMRSRADLMTPL